MRLRLKQQRLHEILASSPLSQNHWALRLELSRGHWSEIVNGKHPYPSARTRVRMVEAFGVPLEELFEVEVGADPWAGGDFRRAIADRYLVDTEVGQGGMGAVYLARDVRHGRLVAIKVISPEAVSGIGLAQFQREISAVAQLQHPNILPLFDSGDAVGHPFFVMPLVRGGSLRARLATVSRLGLPEAIALVGGIAAGLAHAHREHILHCDVKPENVLLHESHAWVTDFGIARRLHNEIQEWPRGEGLEISAGTPAYVSPEQASGERDLDARSDVYSLGCMTWEMLAGRPPFTGTNTREVVSRRFLAPPPPLRDLAPEVPGAVQSVIERAMALPRDRRQSGAKEFADELAAAAAGHSRVWSAAGLAASRTAARLRGAPASRRRNRMGGVMRDFAGDIVFALRGMRRAPAFAAVVILTLGLALGANATMFGIVDRLLLRAPPHIAHPDEVYRVNVARFLLGAVREPSAMLSYAAFTDVRDRTTTFSKVAAFTEATLSFGAGSESRPVKAVLTSGQYFDLLGVRPQAGRFYGESEAVLPSGVPVAVVGFGFWQRALGGASRVLGTSISLSGRSYEVIGVAPRGFTGTELADVDVWVPLPAARGPGAPDGTVQWQTNRGWQSIRVIARVRPGVSPEQAETDAARAYHLGHAEMDEYERRAEARLAPLMVAKDARSAGAVPRVARWLWWMAIIVLLIACANVANLMLARGLSRSGEIAVRRALGGGRSRLLRQFATEALVIAAAGCLVGLALARWGGVIVRRVLLPGTSFDGGPIDGRVFAITVAATLFAALCAGLLPLLFGTRGDLAATMRGVSRQATGHPKRLLASLLVAQVGLATVLLVAAGLFVRSLQRVDRLDMGFAPGEMLTINADELRSAVGGSQIAAFLTSTLEQLRAMPGVVAAGAVQGAPFGSSWSTPISIPGFDSIPPQAGGGPYIFRVGASAMEAMQLRLVKGRLIDQSDDRPGAARVTVVSDHMARTLWPREDPLTKCLSVDGGPCASIVGVVADLHRRGLREDPFFAFFVPLGSALDQERMVNQLVVRTDGDPSRMIEPVRRLLLTIRPDLPYITIRPYDAVIAPQARSWRLGATMFTVFGSLSLVMAAIGVFGVLSFSVTQRLPELGIRAALGATPAEVMRTVLASGARAVALGLGAGCLLALLLAGRLEPLLFDVSARDPSAYGVAAGAIAIAALVACMVPGRRAARVDPLRVLRSE
jgi:predicted permease